MLKPALFASSTLRSSGARRFFDATRQRSVSNTRQSQHGMLRRRNQVFSVFVLIGYWLHILIFKERG